MVSNSQVTMTMHEEDPIFLPLSTFLKQIPAVTESWLATGKFQDGGWWVKFAIDIDHPLAWQTVQQLGHVLNYLSVKERLPTIFMPVSPPPYLNGGPDEFLSWVIECHDPDCTPENVAQCLADTLPNPVGDSEQWTLDE